MNLNGSTNLVEAVGLELADIRRDWRVEAAELRAVVAQCERDIERLMNMAREAVAKLRDGAAGRDGKDGPQGPQGPPGPPGTAGTFKAPAKFEPGKITYAGELIYHEGSTFCALTDTAATPPHADFQPVAYKGRDSYSGRARGLFDAGETYRALDVVTFNGSEWRAVKDNPGPLPGDGWMLGAKGAKGKPGDKGERGERGSQGMPGKDAPSIERMTLVDWTLTLILADGARITCDLFPLFERYQREAT